MNKRAATIAGIPVAEAIGIVLAVIIIAGTINFFGKFISIFTGGGEEKATEIAFKTLLYKINSIMVQDYECTAIKEVPLYIADGYAIIGFSKGTGYQRNICDGKEQIQKPLRPDCPKENSCFCIYKTDDTFSGKQPISCAPISVERVSTKDYSTHPDESISRNMFTSTMGSIDGIQIFGSCDPSLFTLAESFGTKRVYLETKIKKDMGTVSHIILPLTGEFKFEFVFDTPSDTMKISRSYKDEIEIKRLIAAGRIQKITDKTIQTITDVNTIQQGDRVQITGESNELFIANYDDEMEKRYEKCLEQKPTA